MKDLFITVVARLTVAFVESEGFDHLVSHLTKLLEQDLVMLQHQLVNLQAHGLF